MSIFQQFENEKEKNEMTDDYSLPDEPGHTLTSFGESNFKREYELIGNSDRRLESHHRGRLYEAVRRLIEKFCEAQQIAKASGIAFINELCKEWEMEDTVAVAAERLWTSAKPFASAGNREFCSIYNQVLREDRASCARDSAIIAWALNANLTRARADCNNVEFPPRGVCWRGGGFYDTPNTRRFFEDKANAANPAEKKYRANMFLPTSFKKVNAEYFMGRAAESLEHGSPPNSVVMWKVTVDPRGETLDMHKCKQANLIKHRTATVGQEWEFLFAAFSVFSVMKVKWSPDATDPSQPHKIHIHAATDNSAEDEGLPLAPWS